MQAVILVAGKSQRFYPFTSFAHKSMVIMAGKTLLEHTLESLKKSHITEVIIVVGKDSTIPQAIKHIPGIALKYVVQEKAEGMGHALLQAEKYLHETFFLLSGYHVDFADVYKEMLQKQTSQEKTILLAREDVVLDRYGVVEVENDSVVALTERPENTKEKGLRVIGIYLLNKTFIQMLKKIPVEQYHFEKALDTYAREGNVKFVLTSKPTITLKHSWDLLTTKDYILSKTKPYVSKKASVAKSAILQGNIHVSDGVTILEGACIKGPCYLGKNVIVGNNAIIRGGVIAEENVVIGATMEVKNSHLMKNVTTHTGFIGDSIIGEHSRLAAGFCTANVRFDRGEISAKVKDVITRTYRTHVGAILGEYVDMGINVATMPGICVGNHVRVGPGTVVMVNVDDSMLLYTKFQTVIKKNHE